MSRFTGRTVIVTGAGSGIGRAAARLYAEEGATVFCADVTEQVEETARMIGASAHALRSDAGKEQDVAALVAAALSRTGRLDVMFANAGVSGGLAGLWEQDEADWAEILRINLIGPFLAIKHASRPMVEAGRGAILCTASVAGLRSGAGGAAYSASKAGVINLVQNAAEQLSGSGIRVNAICPGLIETGMTAPIYEQARAAGKGDRIGRLNPLRRGGSPEELAAGALFLTSDEASYVNGHAMVVDGGLSASHPFIRQELGKVAI